MSGAACLAAGDDEAESSAWNDAPPRNRARRILKCARIIFNDAYCGVDCVVLDLTPDGALPQADNAHLCPDIFHLRMLSGEVYTCTLDWRDGTKIGFKILPDAGQRQPVEQSRAAV